MNPVMRLFAPSRLLRSLSWRGIAIFAFFAAALSAWTWSGVLFTHKNLGFEEHAEYLLSLFQRSLLSYFPAYIFVAIADGLDLRGMRRRIVLVAALVLGVALAVQLRCAVNPTQMYYVYEATQLPYCISFPTWRTYIDFPGTFTTPLTIGAMVMIFVFSRRRDAELVTALHHARAVAMEARRQRIESEIAVMQARVDPDGLLDKLRKARALYESSLEEGEAFLEGLIAELRQAAHHPSAATPETP
ncbi:MAG: hypothetical protein ACM3X5_08830 [Bacillota bacterium]